MQNKKIISFLGKSLFLAPPEYAIIKKLEFYKEGNSQKHLSYIAAILRHSMEIIDMEIINTFLAKYKLADYWEAVKKVIRK